MTAKNDLKKYKAHYYEVKYLEKEIKEMYNTVKAVNYDEKTGHGGTDDLTLAVVTHIMKRQEEFEKRLQQLREEEAEILSRIQQIEDGEVCRVLIARYIEFKPWAKIQREMHYSESGLMRLHRTGLDELDRKVK